MCIRDSCEITSIPDFRNTIFSFGNQDSILWQRDIECIDNSVQNLALSDLSLHPNPAEDITFISFNSIKRMDLEFSVFNITGQLMIQGQQNVEAGSNQISLDVNGLHSGMYMLRLVNMETGAERSMKLAVD